jgi:hypothetical protein
MTDIRTLVTFGCSWTQGVGAQWTPDMTDENKFLKSRMSPLLNDPYAFRTLLTNKFNLKNKNIAVHGASNDYNFEQANMIFGDPKKKKEFLDSKPIVLWGITSTARIYRNQKTLHLTPDRPASILLFLQEPYVNAPSNEDLKYILHNQETLYATLYLKLFYDHQKEVERLSNLMHVWNDVFAYHNVPVVWFDSFNTHAYPNLPENLIVGDLLSLMLTHQQLTHRSNKKWYHLSEYFNDDDRITVGVKNHLLNPFSFHPSQMGHEIICKILTPFIQSHLE